MRRTVFETRRPAAFVLVSTFTSSILRSPVFVAACTSFGVSTASPALLPPQPIAPRGRTPTRLRLSSMSRVTAWANFASHLAHPASGSAVRAALLRFFVSDGFGHLLGRCGARFRAAYAVAENSACSRRVCEALCVSHQRSPLVLQGCQRAKRPCSCPNKTLGYRLQSVLGARSARCEKIRFRAQSPKSSKKLLAALAV